MAIGKPTQIDLFEHVAGAFCQPQDGRLTNQELYRMVAGRAGIDPQAMATRTPVGRSATPRSTMQRSVRWHQQSLRRLGLIERVEGARGVWQLTAAGRGKLRKARDDVAVLAFSTDLGVAIWSNCTRTFERFEEPIFCAITSPPYPLARPRAYGNPTLDTYVDFICGVLEPIVRNLVPGGNIVLSVGDVYERGSPAKSTYIEEMTIALKVRLGLHLMNRIVWASNKPPGPIQWASISRQQLNEGYEFLLWFCNDPARCIADNRRILEPHTAQQRKLIENGGEQRESSNGDGAHRVRRGSYGKPTSGRIPRSVFLESNYCASQREYKDRARSLGLAAHGAPMPLAIARKLVRFLTDVGQLVAEPLGGSLTTPLACELENRPWMATENAFDYIRGSAERFRECQGFTLNIETC
jgi:DNA modification methylase